MTPGPPPRWPDGDVGDPDPETVSLAFLILASMLWFLAGVVVGVAIL